MKWTWKGTGWKLMAVGLAVGLLLGTAALVRAPTIGPQPIFASHFALEIDGVQVGQFQEVSGLSVEVEVIEYKTGEDRVTHKIPGAVRYSDIVLKRGVAGNDMLWQWFQGSVNGDPDRKNGAVILYDNAGHEAVRYDFYRAFPVKWQGPTLDASSSGLAVESITIAHEGFMRVGP